MPDLSYQDFTAANHLDLKFALNLTKLYFNPVTWIQLGNDSK